MKKMMISVLAVLSAATAAKAQVNFDNKMSEPTSFSALLQASSEVQNDKISPPAPVFEQQDPAAEALRTIKVSMNRGDRKETETLVCREENKELRIQGCKKQSDGAILTRRDVVDMVLQGFFPSEDFGTFPLAATRHEYCNQSGPEFFYCWDVTEYELVLTGKKTKYITECSGKVEASYSGFPSISGGVSCSYRTEEENTYENRPIKTHECKKVDHC